MKFPYVRYGSFYRPVIPVTLRTANKSILIEVLLDTGADISILHDSFADLLGINVTDGIKFPFGGIVGQTFGYRHSINIEIGGVKFSDVPVLFSSHIAVEAYGVLGHEGLFERLKLVFELGKKQIEISPKNYD